MIGKGPQQVLVALPERKSRLSLPAKVVRKHVDGIVTAVIDLLKLLALPLHTLTSDNGKEFAQHEMIVQPSS